MVNLSYKIRDQNPFIVIAQVYNEILVLCCVFVFCGRFFFFFFLHNTVYPLGPWGVL